LSHILPEDGILLAKHVGVLSLMFICILYCAFLEYIERIHHLYLRCTRNVSYTWMD